MKCILCSFILMMAALLVGTTMGQEGGVPTVAVDDLGVREKKALPDFTYHEVRFDESAVGLNNKETPRIPKDWRFVGVMEGRMSTAGHDSIVTNLWFQGADGRIYVLTAFQNAYREFVLLEKVSTIAPK